MVYFDFWDSSIFLLIEAPVSYTHLRAHETREDLVCRLLLEKKNPQNRNEEAILLCGLTLFIQIFVWLKSRSVAVNLVSETGGPNKSNLVKAP